MSFWAQFIIGTAITLLRVVVKDPKRYASIKHLVDELRADVDEADDALGAGGPVAVSSPPNAGQPG